MKAVQVDSLFDADVPPGAYTFYSAYGMVKAGLHFKCPCGCGIIAGVRFKTEVDGGWTREGPDDCLTLHPSVKILDDSIADGHWHGFLTKGEWVSC